MNQYRRGKPRDASDNGTDMLKGNTSSRLTIVKNNHVGTTCDVYDHSSTTHVDCESSVEESSVLPESMEGTKEEYPWFSASNIKKWIGVELREPRRSWTIDNYEGAESFKELSIRPVRKEDAGKNMPPSEFQALKRQLQGIEVELEELMNKESISSKSRNRRWKHWTKVAMELCDEFGTEEDETEAQGEDVQSHQNIANKPCHVNTMLT